MKKILHRTYKPMEYKQKPSRISYFFKYKVKYTKKGRFKIVGLKHKNFKTRKKQYDRWWVHYTKQRKYWNNVRKMKGLVKYNG